MTGCIHCISSNETHIPLLSTSSPLLLETFSSVPLLYPLFPNLLCFHVLLYICNTRALSCFRAPCEGQLLALTQDVMHLPSGARLRQTCSQEHVSPAGCLPGSCRTACGSQRGPMPLPLPGSMPWCDARPSSCALAKQRHGDKDGTEGAGGTAN